MSAKGKFLDLFKNSKPILGMLHLKGDTDEKVLQTAIKEMDLLTHNGVDAVVVENYFGKPHHVEMVLKYLKENRKDIIYGVNLLDDDALGFELAKKYDAKFIQLDSVAGHLDIPEDLKFHKFITAKRKECNAFVLGGVRFKYQPYKSGRSLEEDLKIAMTRCDAIVVTGAATGMETDLDKINSFRKIIGDFTLVVGAGMTPENCSKQLEIADAAIVGSYFKDTHKDTGDVSADHVRYFMDAVQSVRIRMKEKPETDNTARIKIRQYSTFKEELFNPKQIKSMDAFCTKYGLEGTEVFMDDILSRDKVLFTDAEQKAVLVEKLKALKVKRIHCSYWAYPTSFLAKLHFSELSDRFGGSEAIVRYYGDLTGDHMFERWQQEYEIACALGAQAYTFHLIDYAPIDGRWAFTLSKEEIHNAMVLMIQQFLNILLQKGILTKDSPCIELENAGWGLEYGIQTAEEYARLFDQLYDPFKKVKVGWDINHLLHATGFDERLQTARFFLPEEELTTEMQTIEQQYGSKPNLFVQKWLEHNLLYRGLRGRIGSLHVSDCLLKKIEYFRCGKLIGVYGQEMDHLDSWESQENYGVGIVLSRYDSHVPIGEGAIEPSTFRQMIQSMQAVNPDMVLLHELKNSTDQESALKKQLKNLSL